MRDLSAVGSVAGKAFAYFLFFSTLALIIGLLLLVAALFNRVGSENYFIPPIILGFIQFGLTSALLVGWATGGILFGWLTDRIGRVRTLQVTILTYALATAACAFARDIWTLVALRFASRSKSARAESELHAPSLSGPA